MEFALVINYDIILIGIIPKINSWTQRVYKVDHRDLKIYIILTILNTQISFHVRKIETVNILLKSIF